MFLKYALLDVRSIEPKIMTPDAACADLALPCRIVIGGHEHITVPLLIAFDIPVDWCLYIQPRSSTFSKHGLLSTTGIIDSDYKGTVHAQLYNMDNFTKTFEPGTRLVQVQLFQKQRIQFEQVSSMPTSKTRRPEMGSTGE
jgi:dUTP pyrophosphatase